MRSATTENLIDDLVRDLEVSREETPFAGLLLVCCASALAGVVAFFGVRPHFFLDLILAEFLFKEVYVSALAGAALWLAWRSGRPGVSLKRPVLAMVAVLGVGMLVGAVDLAVAAGDQRAASLFGETWRVCARNIVALSVCPAPVLVFAMRRMAPVYQRVSGAAIGASAGAIAAAAYGLLFCPEVSPAFVATWYTGGIMGAAGIGAVVGRSALNW